MQTELKSAGQKSPMKCSRSRWCVNQVFFLCTSLSFSPFAGGEFRSLYIRRRHAAVSFILRQTGRTPNCSISPHHSCRATSRSSLTDFRYIANVTLQMVPCTGRMVVTNGPKQVSSSGVTATESAGMTAVALVVYGAQGERREAVETCALVGSTIVCF